MSQPPNVAVIIVNYRTPQLVLECLDSLRSEIGSGAQFQVYVGDADSQDGSVEVITQGITAMGIQSWAQCIDIGENGGFAFGNNAIYDRFVAGDPAVDYVYFLNPDTYIHPGALQALVAFLAAHPRVGVAGSKLENPDGSPRAYGFRYPAPWREFFHGACFGPLDRLVPTAALSIQPLHHTQRVDWVTGASFMVRHSVIRQIGTMDAGYFLYFEETDFMKRIANAGHEIWHVADSRVVHLAGQSTGVRTGDTTVKRLSPIWLTSRARYFRRHHGRSGLWLATMLFLAGDAFGRVTDALRRKTRRRPPHLWGDYLKPRPTPADQP